MKIKNIALPLVLSSVAVSAQADDSFKTSFYGEITAQAQKKDGHDFAFGSPSVKAGVKGAYFSRHVKAFATIEAMYSENFADNPYAQFNGYDNDIQVTKADVVLVTDYGTFVTGVGDIGPYTFVQNMVDIGYVNNGSFASNNKMLWEEMKEGGKVFVYNTPDFDIGLGKVKFGGVVVTPKDQNDVANDITSLSAQFASDKLDLSVFYGITDKEVVGTRLAAHNQTRLSIGTTYRATDNLTLAATAELQNHQFDTADDTYVAAIKYRHNKFDFGLSYQYKTFVDGANHGADYDEQSLVIANVGYNYTDAITFFVEGALYGEEPSDYIVGSLYEVYGYPNGYDVYSGDSVSVGIRVKL